jgi:hypothetical protein
MDTTTGKSWTPDTINFRSKQAITHKKATVGEWSGSTRIGEVIHQRRQATIEYRVTARFQRSRVAHGLSST